MKVLLDTHAFLWLVMDDPKLSRTAKSIFLDNTNEILLSAVSGFEIAVKYSLGKLELNEEPKAFVENRIQANALTVLPVNMEHTLKLAELPFHHRDPFDRLLIAQALVEDVPLLSKDAIFSNYQGLNCIW